MSAQLSLKAVEPLAENFVKATEAKQMAIDRFETLSQPFSETIWDYDITLVRPGPVILLRPQPPMLRHYMYTLQVYTSLCLHIITASPQFIYK